MIRSFSKIGSLHKERREENQDAVLSGERGRFLVLALADGISACRASGAGARAACHTAVELLLEHGERLFLCGGETAAEWILAQIFHELSDRFGGEDIPLEEYASTIVCVLLDKEAGKAFYCGVGDSLILTAGQDRCRIAAMPDLCREGCCSTVTRYAARRAQAGTIEVKDAHTLLLCSDGAWRLMYEKNRLNPGVKQMLMQGDCGGLERYLNEKENRDDCSLICYAGRSDVGEQKRSAGV